MFVPSQKLIEAEKHLLTLDLEHLQSGDQLFGEDPHHLREALRLLQEAQIDMNENAKEGRLIEVWGGKRAVIVNKDDEVTVKAKRF